MSYLTKAYTDQTRMSSSRKFLASRGDPTQTLTLRRLFSLQFKLRFDHIQKLSTKSITTNDCFGLKGNKTTTTKLPLTLKQTDNLSPPNSWKDRTRAIPPNAFKFMPDPRKIDSFIKWLKEMEQLSLFQVVIRPQIGTAINPIWANLYIANAYKHGMLWGRRNIRNNPSLLKKLGLSKSDIPITDEAIGTAFLSAIHADSVGAIYTRAYTDLVGITAAMDAEISRALAVGLVLGENPRVIAKKIADRIDKIGKTRATILARTEVIRAHHIASIQTYEDFGVEGVMILAEWSTAGDSRVCHLCKPLEGKIFTLEQIKGKIPLHPQCRCAAIPILKEE